jgi:hypothetical protein
MRSRPSQPSLLLGALVLAAAPGAAHAQFATLEARAGVVRAVGKYADALGTGQTLGVGASMRFTPTLSVRLDADASTGFENDPATPDLYSYMLGLETQLLPTRGLRRAPLQLTATLSGGATQLRYGAYDSPTAPGVRIAASDEFRPSIGAGLRLTAEPSRNLGIFVGASAVGTLLGGAQSTPDVAVGAVSRPLSDGGTLVTVPLVAGLRIRF